MDLKNTMDWKLEKRGKCKQESVVYGTKTPSVGVKLNESRDFSRLELFQSRWDLSSALQGCVGWSPQEGLSVKMGENFDATEWSGMEPLAGQSLHFCPIPDTSEQPTLLAFVYLCFPLWKSPGALRGLLRFSGNTVLFFPHLTLPSFLFLKHTQKQLCYYKKRKYRLTRRKKNYKNSSKWELGLDILMSCWWDTTVEVSPHSDLWLL
jgi:hypothetical protein